MLVIGHRGAAGLAPENTIEALRTGYEAGADVLELDVHLTKDKVLVVIHDTRLYRTHRQFKSVGSATLEQLQDLTKKRPIPVLEDVLDEFFGRILLNIELKSKGSAKVLYELLKKKYIHKQPEWDNLFISSFKPTELKVFRKLTKRANLALLHDQNPFLFIAYERQLRLTAVGFHRLYINKLALSIAKKLGIFTYAYTVNRPHTALLLDREGIDGVVTNYPHKILNEINQHLATQDTST